MTAPDTSELSSGGVVVQMQRLAAWLATRRGTLFVVTGLALIGLGLRLWRLDSEPMHVDELLQAGHVQAGWGELVGLSYRHDAPPLDYVIGKLVVTVAPATDFVQRLPAVVFGAASIGVVGGMIVRSGYRLAGVMAAGFLAVSPFLVRTSQFARPYMLPVFLVAGTLALYQHWCLGSKTRRTAVWFGVMGALAIVSRPLMPMLALAALGLIALIAALNHYGFQPVRLIRRDPLALGVLPALFLLVWVPNLLLMRANGSGSWLVDCWQCDKWDRLANGIQRFGEFGEVTLRPLSLNLLLFLGLVVLVFPSVRRELAATRFIWVPLLATAPAFALVHAMMLQPDRFFVDRYLVFLPVGLAVYFAIVVAGLLRAMRSVFLPLRVVLRISTVLVVVLALNTMLSEAKSQTEGTYLADWRSVADHIEAIEVDRDLIVMIDTRPFKDEVRYGFDIAAGRYYGGSLDFVTPNDLIRVPGLGLDAARYHFVLFVPRLIENWEFPESWIVADYSQMRVVTTSEVQSSAERVDAWWVLTQQLRPDVAIRSQIAGAALEAEAGVEKYPWIEVAIREAGELGQEGFAEALIATSPAG